MENQQVGLEGVKIGLRGLDEELGGMAADGAVLDDGMGMGVRRAAFCSTGMVGDGICPGLEINDGSERAGRP